MKRSLGLNSQAGGMPPGPICSKAALGKLILAGFARLFAQEQEPPSGASGAADGNADSRLTGGKPQKGKKICEPQSAKRRGKRRKT